jgi:hypothetical protein
MSLPQIMEAARRAELQLRSDGHNVEAEAVRRLLESRGRSHTLNSVLHKDLQRTRALLRRAHDAMSRRDPDGISDAYWDQLLADIAKEKAT